MQGSGKGGGDHGGGNDQGGHHYGGFEGKKRSMARERRKKAWQESMQGRKRGVEKKGDLQRRKSAAGSHGTTWRKASQARAMAMGSFALCSGYGDGASFPS